MTRRHRIKLYNPKIPSLKGLTDEERDRALEEYMRESARSLRTIFAQVEEMINNGIQKE